jgi:MraZ protein
VLESKGGSKANSAAQFRLKIEYYGESEVVEFDGNGRILIPQFLRDYAGLSANVVIVGMGSNLLICTPEVWEATQEEFADNKVFDDKMVVFTAKA